MTSRWRKSGLNTSVKRRGWRIAGLAADFQARYRMSLADAFAAALAKEKKAELVTGDPEFKALEGEVKIRWIGGMR
jgi:predicted nucleic acid-binding protein